MRESSPFAVISKVARTAVLAVALTLLMPVVAAALVMLYVAARYRGAHAQGDDSVMRQLSRSQGVKTMSEVMEILEGIPFGKGLHRLAAMSLMMLTDTLPTALNTNRLTAGMVYPYPREFEPVMLDSQDGTPVCGLLAMQPGNEVRPALVLVHGLYGSKNQYGIQCMALHAYYDWGFHVLSLDLRNFGDSSRFSEAPTSWGYRESDDVLAAAEYLDSLDGVSTVGACGVSLGAASVLVAASRSLVDGPLSGGVVALNGYADAAMAIQHVSECSFSSPERFGIWMFFRLLLAAKTAFSGPRLFVDLREYTRQVAAQYYEMGESELYRKASPVNSVREIEVPCLVVHSLDDYIVPVRQAEELQAAAKDNPMVAFITVPGGGHALYSLTHSRWFNRTLETFFSYWGETRPGPEESLDGIEDTEMFGNPNN